MWENRDAVCIQCSWYVGVRILGTFVCIHMLGMGLISAWGCMIGHNLLLFILFAGHYLSGKWNPMTSAHR